MLFLNLYNENNVITGCIDADFGEKEKDFIKKVNKYT